jgi:hypothetical protein
MRRYILVAVALAAALVVGVPLAGALDPGTPAIVGSSPGSPGNTTTPTISGTADPGTDVRLYTDSACGGAVAAGPVTADGSGAFQVQVAVAANSTTTFYATSTDATPTVSPCSSGFTYVEDSTPPAAPTIDTHPGDPTNSTSPGFAFSDADPVASYSCQLDGGGFSGCSSPVSYTGLGSAQHTFQVVAFDDAGNQSGATSFTWTIDATPPPRPAITSGPLGLVATNAAAFTFTDTELGVTFLCQRDGGGYTGCTSPASYSGLAEGLHTFDVKAADALGNDSTARSRSWTVDTLAPATPTITIKPTDPSGSPDATFEFTGDGDPNGKFECKIDLLLFTACTSPQTYHLLDGPHTFSVRELDKVGHASDPASYSWTIDTVRPIVTLTDKPPAITNQTTASFAFTTDQPNSTLECQLDGGGFTSCTSPKLYNGLANGSHTFAVHAISHAGLVGTPTEYTWIVDTVPPQTAIASAPPAQSNSAVANFTFTSNEVGSSFACSLDALGYTPCASPKSYAGLGDGTHVFRVQAVDPAGNNDASAATYTWKISGVGPPTVDRKPPKNVSRLRRNVGYGRIQLRWRKPGDSDFDHVGVFVSTSPKSQPRTLVYKGKSQTYTNKRFKNGVYYRYRVVSYDHADNGSKGTMATVPPSVLLKSPGNGRVVRVPPLLRWSAVRRATFYNVQIYYSGRKVFSAWPAKPQRALSRRWSYQSHRISLRRGRYLWFVWPGFGPRSKSHYGQLLGQGTFRVR